MPRIETELLATAGRLLLEYNDSTRAIESTLAATAAALTTEPLNIAVNYRGVAVALGSETPLLKPVAELRYHAALQAKLHAILDCVRRKAIDPAIALSELAGVEANTKPHSQWLIAMSLGLGAASLGRLLGADAGAAIIAGL